MARRYDPPATTSRPWESSSAAVPETSELARTKAIPFPEKLRSRAPGVAATAGEAPSTSNVTTAGQTLRLPISPLRTIA